MLSDIGAGLVVVPMIAFLTSIAIAQSFSRKNNYQVNPSQELIALGVANVANSFVSGFPIAGCFSRTTVNSLSGVATPFGGKVTKVDIVQIFSVNAAYSYSNTPQLLKFQCNETAAVFLIFSPVAMP